MISAADEAEPSMGRFKSFFVGRCFCIAAGFFGVFSFFHSTDSPEKVVKDFVALFQAQNAAAIYAVMHPDVVGGKDISAADVEQFLKHHKTGSLKFEKFHIDRKMKSEDASTERFQATLTFQGPILSPQYPKPSVFEMVNLWVLEDGKWWLERTFSAHYVVFSDEPYPTAAQDENSVRFEAALAVLDRIKTNDDGAAALVGPTTEGSAAKEYRELEGIYRTERGPKGVDPKADGLQTFLKAASRSSGGLLDIYYGDFRKGPDDNRKPVPWGMFRDYVHAALENGRDLEKRGNVKAAKAMYRGVMSVGRQFISEPGGIQFAIWGTNFQKEAAEELARLAGPGEKQQIQAFLNVVSRRLDLLQTALMCLDDMTDYNSLKSAIIAAGSGDDPIFAPWGINTLTILALKGAPADPAATKTADATVLVHNPVMQRKALSVLNELESEPSGKQKPFIRSQKEWIANHNVYGTQRPYK
jgi:hypothetical protein